MKKMLASAMLVGPLAAIAHVGAGAPKAIIFLLILVSKAGFGSFGSSAALTLFVTGVLEDFLRQDGFTGFEVLLAF